MIPVLRNDETKLIKENYTDISEIGKGHYRAEPSLIIVQPRHITFRLLFIVSYPPVWREFNKSELLFNKSQSNYSHELFVCKLLTIALRIDYYIIMIHKRSFR